MARPLITSETKDGVKRSLILAGGGVRLAYQAGVLQALEEHGLQFNHVDGTSGGIFCSAMLASGLDPNEIAMRWRNVKIKHFMSGVPVNSYLKLARLTAFGDADGIRKHIFPSLGIDLEKIRANTQVNATFNVCNFSDKSIESIPSQQVTGDHLIAGMSLPIFMPAIRIQNSWYSDAVWIKDANLMEAVRRGAEEIWLVWAIGNGREYLDGSFNQYVHMIEMSANGGLLEEYEQIKSLNERIVRGDSPFHQKKPIVLHVIKPVFPLPLDPDLFFKKIDTNTLINIGYSNAKKYLDRIPEKGVPFDKQSTKMNDPGVTLSFRHHFTGVAKTGSGTSPIRFSPSFCFRKINGVLSLEAHASIDLGDFKREVSVGDGRAMFISDKNKKKITLTGSLTCNGTRYDLQADIPLNSWLHWWLGLEFKSMTLEIRQSANRESFAKAVLSQTAWDRFRMLANASLRNFYGPGSKLKEHFRMVTNLYT